MKKIDKSIEIVRSSIIGLSSMSQKSCNAAFDVLSSHYSTVKIVAIDNLLDLEVLVLRKPDLVFLGMEFIPVDPSLVDRDQNKIWITTYLDENGITYTGSPQPAHELQRDKPSAKQRVLDSGLVTSPFLVIKQGEIIDRNNMTLKYPLFIKPRDRGGGVGIDSNSVAYNFEQLIAKVRSIASSLQSDAIIEEYLPGREFSVAILKDVSSADYNVMPIELIAPKDRNGVRMLSNKVKTSDTEQIVEVNDEKIRAKVNAIALGVFYALGARDYGRIDIRLDENGKPNFLEANLIPSLINGYGSFPRACIINSNISYESMIMKIAELGLSNSRDIIEDLIVAAPIDNSVLATREAVA
jgi:D-alanine-D-alanine ligase